MSKRNLKIGELGEEKAVELLKNKSFKILDRNVETKYGEIDIVARDNETIVFVEVRSRSGLHFGLPEKTIKKRKKRKLIENAKRYINYKNIKNPYRIDVVGVVFNKSKKVNRIKHYRNITL